MTPTTKLAVLRLFPTELGQWTDDDVTRAAEVVDAVLEGHLITNADGALIASPKTYENLPKRETTAKAKEIAAEIGRPKPSKFDDVLSDVVVYAAVLAA